MICIKCGEKEDNPYVVKSGKRKGKVQSYCRKCNHENTLERQRSMKQKCVDYKGGKCCRCGYDKYIGALDFHHLDPSHKEHGIAGLRFTSFEKNEKVKQELDKCILVCRNCHAEIHGGL